jgi:hypothetical protein
MAIENLDTPGWKFYMNHLQYFFNKDIDGLVANDYTPDATVIAGEFAVKGTEAMKELFTGYLGMVGDFTLRETTKFQETDDAIILEATMDTANTGERKVYDCFVMRDGKISHHFTGVR